MHSCVQTFLISIQWMVKFVPIHYLDTVRVDTINIFILHFFPSIFLPLHSYSFHPSPPLYPFHFTSLPCLPNLSSTHFLFFSLQFPSPFHFHPLPCLLNSSSIHVSSFSLTFSFPLPFTSLVLPSQSILNTFLLLPRTFPFPPSIYLPLTASSIHPSSSSIILFLQFKKNVSSATSRNEY